MKEIGGYLELENPSGYEYYSDLKAVNSARNGLLYLLKAKRVEKLYIPYFLCDSVSGVCKREGFSYEYYNVTSDFLPDFDKKLESNEYLYIVNYYGQISNERIIQFKQKFKNIILDNVQAFFQKPLVGIDTIYSCRKFFGVPDGAYVSTDADIKTFLPQDLSYDRMTHILGRYEKECASSHYADFRKNEQRFAELELRNMSNLTHALLKAIDYEAVKSIREENFKFLNEKLASVNLLKLSVPVGPYAYPFYCKSGSMIKKELAEQKIYIPTLWPEVIQMGQPLEKKFAENILPLPCDQRYDLTDMERVVFEILKRL